MRVVVAAVTLAVLALASVGPCLAETQRESRRFGPPFKPLDIRVTVGEVEIRATERADIVIEIERTAPDAAGLARMPVDVADTEDTLIVNVTQRHGETSAVLRAKVVAFVPLLAAFSQVAVFEGRIAIDGLRGSIRARIDRGPIHASHVAGLIRLETVAGDLIVEESALNVDGLLRLRTFNGAIRVGLLRAPRDARVLLLTLNGVITSDLPLAERAGFGPRFREGTFGSAQPLLSADAVRGDIVVTVGK